jgi:hypothetical protein
VEIWRRKPVPNHLAGRAGKIGHDEGWKLKVDGWKLRVFEKRSHRFD